MKTRRFRIVPDRGHGRCQCQLRGRAALLVALVAVIVWALLPIPSRGEIFYGLADTTLQVNQEEQQGTSSYETLRTWSLPVTLKFRVETDFASSELLGIDLNIHETIYEDVSQNFEFSFGIEGSIFGPSPVDIDIIPGTDDWESEFYWDVLHADLTLNRRVFTATNHFETHVFDDMVWFARDVLNFNGYPGSITYIRDSGAWPLGSVPYSDIGRLSFRLYRQPNRVSVSPAICDHSGCGDYNQNGIVDAADYTVYRDTLGQTGQDLAADGNSNERVEIADYVVWTTHFGESSMELGPTQSSVPEPTGTVLATIGIAASLCCRQVGGRRRIL